MRTDDFLEVMHELVAFVRVAETGSFSAAARQQGVTPSAISRQVARLEKTMGVSLLQRTTRQLRLTDGGLEVLTHGRAMVAAAQATLEVAEGHVGEPQGLVRVSAPKAFARHMHTVALNCVERYNKRKLNVAEQSAKLVILVYLLFLNSGNNKRRVKHDRCLRACLGDAF